MVEESKRQDVSDDMADVIDIENDLAVAAADIAMLS